VSKVTNALFIPHAALLTGVWAPAPVVGRSPVSAESKLSFVVWVYPVKQPNE